MTPSPSPDKVTPNISPRRLLFYRILLSLFSVVLMLGMLELGMWVLGINPPQRDDGTRPHPIWHHWHPKNYRLDYYVKAEGYTKPVTFNEHGLRESRSISVAKPPGVFRIAVLGDSFVEAMQVEEDETLVRQLEKNLQPVIRQKMKQRLEVLNFGCRGFCTSLEMLLLREFVLKFEPDMVILVHFFNDISDDSQFGVWAHYQGKKLVAVRKPGAGKGRDVREFFRRSRLVRLVSGALHERRRARQSRLQPKESLLVGWDAIVHDPYTPDDEKAWKHSLGYLGQIADMLRQRRIPFLVAVIPIPTQVEPVSAQFAAESGALWLAGGKRLEYTGYQRKLTAYCRSKGIAYLDLLPAFRAANPSGRTWLFLPKDGHWTAAGHALAARKITEYLQAGKGLKP
ncbi:MAG: GDSL-type esterase/lipase family protein [Armatimonadota bacterium]|nr:GDSL-type esterase/lipase family protein [Armatimonadota bacterium]